MVHRQPDERPVLDAVQSNGDHRGACAETFTTALIVSGDAVLRTGEPELLVDSSW